MSKGALELALSADRILSPPFDLKLGNGQTVSVRFRELSDLTKGELRLQAIGWVETRRRAVESEIGHELRDIQAELEAERCRRWDLLLVHAALVDAENPEQEACSLMIMEHRLDPTARVYLSTKYQEFEESVDPNKVTPEMVEELVEELKKKQLSPTVCWRRYGSAALWSCLHYMADQLLKSQGEQSTGGSSSET